ncbi:MAG: hypothetical protein WD751_10660 [Anaerolineales bacterium]
MAITPRLLFLSFLGLGLVTGLFLGSLGQAIAAPAGESGQHNYLFVLVDDLGAEHPTLEGIWLAARTEDSATWNWMPVYPVPLDETESVYAKPHAAFYLPSGNFDDVNALPPLRTQGAWWDEVFWIDEAALGVLQGLSGSSASLTSDTWIEPQRALYEQVQILNNVCNSAAAIAAAGPGALDQLLALVPAHLDPSISPFELITRWDDWTQSGFALNCAHPWAN